MAEESSSNASGAGAGSGTPPAQNRGGGGGGAGNRGQQPPKTDGADSQTAKAPTRKPTVGRAVHYVLGANSANAGQHRAGTITYVHDSEEAVASGISNVNVLMGLPDDFPSGAHPSVLMTGVPFDEDGSKPGSWHWPEGAPR